MSSLPADADLAAAPAAVTDMRCKRETDYLAGAYTTLARLQQDLLDRDPSLARDWTTLQARQDAAAQTILEA